MTPVRTSVPASCGAACVPRRPRTTPASVPPWMRVYEIHSRPSFTKCSPSSRGRFSPFSTAIAVAPASMSSARYAVPADAGAPRTIRTSTRRGKTSSAGSWSDPAAVKMRRRLPSSAPAFSLASPCVESQKYDGPNPSGAGRHAVVRSDQKLSSRCMTPSARSCAPRAGQSPAASP
ncbi:MAG TPA: hypothetical protein DCM87_03105 [Planctomycetes bacterium]|nr:hypothetical protein [Planctomycetota bacterium]